MCLGLWATESYRDLEHDRGLGQEQDDDVPHHRMSAAAASARGRLSKPVGTTTLGPEEILSKSVRNVMFRNVHTPCCCNCCVRNRLMR